MNPASARAQHIPRWMGIGWALAVPGTAALALRLLYEATLLTWREGPQMVGFALVHSDGLLFPWGFASALLMLLWLLVAAAWCVARAIRKRPIDRRAWWALLASALFLGVIVGVPAVSG